MTKKQNPAVASQTGRGDRIIQVILLVLIAAGIIGIPLVLRGGNSGGAAMGPGAGPGAGPGGPGGFPGGGAPGDEGEARTAVRVQDAVLGDIREYIRVNGDVDAASSVGIYPDTSGKLTDLTVAPGDSVRRGQVIGMVDASLSGQVYKPNAVAATINGTVTAVNSDIGETVNTATEIVTIGNLSSLKVITYIPERYVGAVRVGMEAEVVLDAYPDAVFPARVTEMSPVLDTPSRSQKTSLSFLASDPRIRVGIVRHNADHRQGRDGCCNRSAYGPHHELRPGCCLHSHRRNSRNAGSACRTEIRRVRADTGRSVRGGNGGGSGIVRHHRRSPCPHRRVGEQHESIRNFGQPTDNRSGHHKPAHDNRSVHGSQPSQWR